MTGSDMGQFVIVFLSFMAMVGGGIILAIGVIAFLLILFVWPTATNLWYIIPLVIGGGLTFLGGTGWQLVRKAENRYYAERNKSKITCPICANKAEKCSYCGGSSTQN